MPMYSIVRQMRSRPIPKEAIETILRREMETKSLLRIQTTYEELGEIRNGFGKVF